MPVNSNQPSVIWLLRLACASVLAGHGWLCLHGHMPLRALLWDEELFSGLVKRFFDLDWGEWVSSMEVDDGITEVIRIQGWVFMGLALAALVPLRHLAFRCLYLFASLDLMFLAWLKFHDSSGEIAQFYEHSSQFLLPAILFLAAGGHRWVLLAKIAVAATFVGHGLYALGWTSEMMWFNHPRPGHFTEMTMVCLGIESEVTANRILFVAGVLDLVAALFIFLPGWFRKGGLAYMIVWGFLTALARPWANYNEFAVSESLSRWLPEFVYRFPHFMLPLCILLALRPGRAKG